MSGWMMMSKIMDKLRSVISLMSSSEQGELETQGSNKKLKSSIPMNQDGPTPPSSVRSHLLEIAAGADIMEEVAAVASRQQRSVLVLSGDGVIVNPILRQKRSGVVRFPGLFQIISMSGVFAVSSTCSTGFAELTVCLTEGQGDVIEGVAVGKFMAASLVMIKLATWSSATNERLPETSDKPADAAVAAAVAAASALLDGMLLLEGLPPEGHGAATEVDGAPTFRSPCVASLKAFFGGMVDRIIREEVQTALEMKPAHTSESLTHGEMQLRDERRVLEGTLSTMHDFMQRAEWCAHKDGMLFMDESVSLGFNHFQEEESMFGRPKELLELINLLCLPGIISKRVKDGTSGTMIAARTDNVSVLPIWGISGVGKTTLAYQIFREKRVCDNFDLLIWLCVSDGFDKKKLIKKFILSVAEREMKSDDLSYLQRILTNGIIHPSRRFLLVIDDVQEDICREDFHEWKSFLAPLKCARPGSMVLVTTRSLRVAEHVGTMKHYVLEGLPEGKLWEFFRMHAFGSDNSDINPVLASIGRSIVSRLNGSPLGAQILGRLLSLKLDPIYWRNILESELWEVQNEREDNRSICSALKLSYQYLPFHLKRCFSFCSMYPRNYEFDAVTLVDCWVAVGLVLPYGRMLPLDVGHVYFQQLVNRSFFQKAPTSSRHVMHDSVYDMAQQTSRNQCFVIKDTCDLSRIPPNVRHLSVLCNGLESSDLESLQAYKVLCSVICISTEPNIIPASVVERWFRDLVNIRMLRFISCQLKELPNNVGNLVHLRYLDISACEFDKFPDSLWRLYNLEILDARNCKIQDVPKDIIKLLNLQRVILKGDLIRQLGCLPGISNLLYLQEMPYYSVQDEPGRRIHELKNMDHLRGLLEISGLCSVIGMEQSAEAALHKKIYLNTLILSWHESIRPEKHNSNQEMEVLEGLRPSSNIKHLEVKFYMGAGFYPSWLHEDVLSSLSSLSISSCPHITTLFGQPSRTDGSSSSSTGSFTGFRSLTKLCITWCKRLTGLDNFLHPEYLPAIKVIRISNCEDLVSLPTKSLGEFVHLEDLEVSHCWSLNWEKGLTLPPSLKVLKLEACGEFSDSMLSCLGGLAALTNLDLQFCPSIESIGTQIWSHLQSLKNLKIVCCQGLNSIGGSESIARIRNVDIRHCPKLKELEQPFHRGCYC
ncbi:putative disease resistance protein RGA3 [Lolium perenne]|uniref:putative disease resistance protein RGA3 n=1 Tax=Lolium perenne TaxID=4522 RepID=UPI003A9967C7